MTMSIDKDTYTGAHTAVRMAYSLLDLYPFGKIIEAQKTAHAIGPILDPTLYRDKMQAMDEDRVLFEAAHAFVSTIAAALEKAGKKP